MMDVQCPMHDVDHTLERICSTTWPDARHQILATTSVLGTTPA